MQAPLLNPKLIPITKTMTRLYETISLRNTFPYQICCTSRIQNPFNLAILVHSFIFVYSSTCFRGLHNYQQRSFSKSWRCRDDCGKRPRHFQVLLIRRQTSGKHHVVTLAYTNQDPSYECVVQQLHVQRSLWCCQYTDRKACDHARVQRPTVDMSGFGG